MQVQQREKGLPEEKYNNKLAVIPGYRGYFGLKN